MGRSFEQKRASASTSLLNSLVKAKPPPCAGWPRIEVSCVGWWKEIGWHARSLLENKKGKDFDQNCPKLGLRRILKFRHKMRIFFSANVIWALLHKLWKFYEKIWFLFIY
jgi:hypothetical protein